MDSRRSARQCGKCRFYLDVCPCLFRKKVGYFDNCGPKGCRGRAESSLVRPQAHTPCPGWGPDAPTTARMVGLPPRVGQYFLSKRKKVPKKARGTATTKTAHVAARRGLRPAVAPSGLSSASARCAHPPEKGFYCPFCRRGSQRRAHQSGELFPALMRAPVLAFFRRQNGRAFFPSLPIAARLRRRLGGRRN